MKTRMFSGLLVLALVSLSLVSAKSVSRWIYEQDESFTLPAKSDSNPCDFDIEWVSKGTGFVIGWWDDEGHLIRAHDVSNHVENSFSANGKTIDVGTVNSRIIILDDDKFLLYYLGISDFITIPGYGQVWGSAGQFGVIYQYDPVKNELIEIDVVKWAGINNFSDFSPVCEYLAN